MANNKKIFTIEINGIEESIKAVDNLQMRIESLNDTIKDMAKQRN